MGTKPDTDFPDLIRSSWEEAWNRCQFQFKILNKLRDSYYDESQAKKDSENLRDVLIAARKVDAFWFNEDKNPADLENAIEELAQALDHLEMRK